MKINSIDNIRDHNNELKTLCLVVKDMIMERKFSECQEIICKAMAMYPHSPEPHNLIGIVLEKQNNHETAMKHFRAAWNLDPTYLPAKHNLDCFGNFLSRMNCAYDESDCDLASVK